MKTERFLAAEGKKVDLKDHPTDYTGDYNKKDDAIADLEKNIDRLANFRMFSTHKMFTHFSSFFKRWTRRERIAPSNM